jgi:hypothetical protein
LFHSTTIDRYKVSNLLLAPAILTISAKHSFTASATDKLPPLVVFLCPWKTVRLGHPAPALMTPKQMKGEKEFGAAKAKYRPRFGPIKR